MKHCLRLLAFAVAFHILPASAAEQEIVAKVMVTAPGQPHVIEDVVFDAKTGRLFLSSIDDRTIYAVKDGAVTRFADPQGGSLLGMALSTDERTLWACSTVAKIGKEYMRPDEKEHAEVIAIDADRGTIRRMIAFPEPDQMHFCDSISVAPNGDLYVTDSGTNSICLLPRGAERMTKCVESFGRTYPQGTVPLGNGKLLVAGYGAGILELDFARETWRKLPSPPASKLGGIDGLSRYKNCLIGVQNGAKPARILVLHLSKDQRTITSVQEVKTEPAEPDEPTWGDAMGDKFVFIGNSQNETFRTKGRQALQPTLLFQFDLPRSCAE